MNYPFGQKPPQWSIDPGVVAYNASRLGLPMPIVYWPAWEKGGTKAYDQSGNYRNGTLTGGAIWHPEGISLPNSAGNGIEWTDDPLLEGTNVTELTLFADFTWVGGGDDFQYVTGKNYNVYQIYVDGSGAGLGNIGFALGTDSGGYDSGTAFNYTLTANERVFLTVTWSATTGDLQYYVNGVKTATANRTGSRITSNANLFCVGKRSGATTRDFNGVIHSSGMFKHALLPAQVAVLYADPYGLIADPYQIETLAYVAVGGNVDVSATTDALILTEYPATVNAEANVQAGTDALIITENVAEISLDVSINVGIDALVLAEASATIKADISIQSDVDSLAITEYPATVNAEANVQAGTDALIITENVAEISLDVSINVGIDALVLAEASATIKADISIQSDVDSLAITEYPATVNAEANVQAGIDALAITENTATINIGINIGAGTDALIITENVADINAEANVQASIDALSIVTPQATVEVGGNVVVSASTDTLLITANVATVNAENNVFGGLDDLVLSEYAASVSTGVGGALFISEQIGLNQMEGLF